MSSIFGCVRLDITPNIYTDDLAIMEKRLNHWNADSCHTWHDGTIGLGHLMLYNTPESLNELLPYQDPVTSIAITADARIDNRHELYTNLHLYTSEEKKCPDSMLIRLLYEKYGERCVDYLIGDFAFVIWDAKRQQLFCVRDQMGVKPFFYYIDKYIFAFATEKKGILAIRGIDQSINKQFLYNQILWYPIQAPADTLYQHIHRLPAAHTLLLNVRSGKVIVQRYWTLDTHIELKLPRKEDYYEELRCHFDEAVRCRLRTIYTPGCELSGGIDSSAITGAACKFTNNKLFTFSNTLSEGITDEKSLRLSERKYIETIIDDLSIKNSVLITEDIWNDPLEEADFSIEVNDGLEMWSPLWQIGIKQAAMQKGVKVLLSGFPGDEMVTYKGGYDHLDQKSIVRNIKQLIPFSVFCYLYRFKNLLWSDKRLKAGEETFHIPLKYRVNRGEAIWKDENFSSRYKNLKHFLKFSLLQPRVQLRMEAETRCGIYYRLEPRFPMADIRLTQFSLSMPNEMIWKDGHIERHTFRQAVKDYLPEVIYKRGKGPASLAPFLHNEGKSRGKAGAVHAIKLRLAEIDHLPVKIKRAGVDMPVHLDVLRWIEKFII